MEAETKRSEFVVYMVNKMLIDIENTLLQGHRQRETTGIKKLYNSFFVLF
ncbi:uncharacterized protein LOC129771524 isoform X2 [Toxorhynchites rutilus septentrionalis]|nr:uncharacterized protein LOC129771524 isoform X2 [Toxorhynchites rutilus septentrionalis]